MDFADDPALRGHYLYCDDLIRNGDRDRWLANLLTPADKRLHLSALYAFNFEVARVREIVSDPIPGELRLQWWRDALADEARGDVRAHPIAAALLDTIRRFALPRKAFADLIDARLFDLYDDPMLSVSDLEGYCGETSSALFRLATLILAKGRDPGGAEACGHAGVAFAITGLLRALPWHAARGQVFVPVDLLTRHGADRADVLAGRMSEKLRAAFTELRQLARHHLRATYPKIAEAAPVARVAFLPVALCPAYLRLMDRPAYDAFKTPIELPQWRRQWILWRS
ncbi:MAG TPA: phytoene/squalene synthase family protein [Beijerinckiaceae bacterium]|jgi:phytoene synthase|nr:phytoene/squalene synthase family protein [Beijerinckiaceae bacterium]